MTSVFLSPVQYKIASKLLMNKLSKWSVATLSALSMIFENVARSMALSTFPCLYRCGWGLPLLVILACLAVVNTVLAILGLHFDFRNYDGILPLQFLLYLVLMYGLSAFFVKKLKIRKRVGVYQCKSLTTTYLSSSKFDSFLSIFISNEKQQQHHNCQM